MKPHQRILMVLIVMLPVNAKSSIQEAMKRAIQVNVKMTQEDFAELRRAAEKRWPGAVLTNSGMVLGLAKMAAQQILGKPKPRT